MTKDIEHSFSQDKMHIVMRNTDCPNCEYHRQRAQNWREEAYKQAGYPLPEREQNPVACKECHLKDLVYDLLGELKVANLKLSVRAKRTWVGLTKDEVELLSYKAEGNTWKAVELAETKLKEKNVSTL